jgi:hypothetical protein
MKKITESRPQRNKHLDLQVREQEAEMANAKRRKMLPWDGKDGPDFEVVDPWDGKR